MRLWLCLVFGGLGALSEPSAIETDCDGLVVQFLHKSTAAHASLATACLQKVGEDIRISLTQAIPTISLRGVKITRASCNSRLNLAMDVLQRFTPFYHQLSFNASLAASVAKALNNIASVVAVFLNSYKCLPFIDLKYVAEVTDRTFFKFFRDFPPNHEMVASKVEHFLYLMRSIEDLTGMRKKLDDEEGDPFELMEENLQETAELDDLRRHKYSELDDAELEKQMLFDAFHLTGPTCET